MRWVPAYFPFTHPSFELEIYFKDNWMEMLGCGIIHKDLMNNCQVYIDVVTKIFIYFYKSDLRTKLDGQLDQGLKDLL